MINQLIDYFHFYSVNSSIVIIVIILITVIILLLNTIRVIAIYVKLYFLSVICKITFAFVLVPFQNGNVIEHYKCKDPASFIFYLRISRVLCLALNNKFIFSVSQHLSTKPKFGLLFDIDGVIIRGKQILPPVKESFKKLQGDNGKFRVPTLFVTNSGNSLRSQKAAELSKWIGVEVMESQVVLAHSPLQMFDYLHNKQILISGQGPITDIACELGFKKTTTIEELVKNFPSLDYINVKKRNPICGPVDPSFPKIEGILLLSEPTNWETPLQLMVDLLVTNGMPTGLPTAIPYPHIPVLACNMDLLWASEAPIPRYGHGAFLLCLENLYKKVTGNDMTYAALVGKPSEITYYHANQMLVNHARSIGIDNIDTIYAIGFV